MNLCQKCNKETKNPKFCSRSCSVSTNNTVSPKRKKKYRNLTCGYCNTIFDSNTKKPFCSKQCKSSHKFENGLYSIHSNSIMKKHIIKQNGYQCSICNISKWNNKKITLILDHIDGNSSNNNPDNLRLVCPNCDSQLPTFKAKNTGNGRKYRMERYYQGKSY